MLEFYMYVRETRNIIPTQKDTMNRYESTRSYLTASSKPLTTNKKNHATKTKLSIRTHPTSNEFSLKTS